MFDSIGMGTSDIATGTTSFAGATETALARLIREQGRLKGWVADELGCDRSRLSRLIAGTRSMTVVEAAAAAEIFGVPIETFVPRPPAEVAS